MRMQCQKLIPYVTSEHCLVQSVFYKYTKSEKRLNKSMGNKREFWTKISTRLDSIFLYVELNSYGLFSKYLSKNISHWPRNVYRQKPPQQFPMSLWKRGVWLFAQSYITKPNQLQQQFWWADGQRKTTDPCTKSSCVAWLTDRCMQDTLDLLRDCTLIRPRNTSIFVIRMSKSFLGEGGHSFIKPQ